MTDSYHFQIEPEPRAEVPKFRIGGVYRQNNGVVVKLAPPNDLGMVLAERVFSPPGEWLNSGGARQLSDGRYPGALNDAEYACHLIPGELVQRDGQWVPADTIGPFGSGASLKTAGDKIVGRVEARLVTAGGASYVPSMGGSVTVYCVGGGGGGGGSGNPVQRAPLPNSDEWRGIGHKAHDTFGTDFIVTKGEVPTAPLHTSPTTDSAYPAIAGLLRG